jgi:hypothetical protein
MELEWENAKQKKRAAKPLAKAECPREAWWKKCTLAAPENLPLRPTIPGTMGSKAEAARRLVEAGATFERKLEKRQGRRRPGRLRPARPRPINSAVPGSGTTVNFA